MVNNTLWTTDVVFPRLDTAPYEQAAGNELTVKGQDIALDAQLYWHHYSTSRVTVHRLWECNKAVRTRQLLERIAKPLNVSGHGLLPLPRSHRITELEHHSLIFVTRIQRDCE